MLFEQTGKQRYSIVFFAQKMARRKSNRKAPAKRKATEPLDIVFTCPFCNHEKSCDVTMEKNKNVGTIKCRNAACGEDFQAIINCKCFRETVAYSLFMI